MKITKKMAKQYVADRNRWYLIQDGEYVKVYRLDFGSKSWIDVCTKSIKDMIAVFTGGKVETDFNRHSYFEYDSEYDCLKYGTSETGIAEEIWKEAKTV